MPRPSAIAALDTLQRGQALQQLLLEAADALIGQYKRYHQGQVWRELLQATYFNPTRLPDYKLINETLHTSEPAYYRNQRYAIEHLAQGIIQQVKPALRLESVAPPATWSDGKRC